MGYSEYERSRALRLFPELLLSDDALLAQGISKKQATEDAKTFDEQYGEDFDVRSLMQSSKDPLTGTLRDLKVDDRDMPVAKNYFDYSVHLRGDVLKPPWSRQMWCALMFLGEICPRCSKKSWVESATSVLEIPKKLDDPHDLLEHLQLLEYGVCPKCGARKHELVRSAELRDYMELILCWGQRSGKSTTGLDLVGYHTHRFLMFPRLHTLSDATQASTPFTFTFLSLTFGTALSLLWRPFIVTLTTNQWYLDYFKLLDEAGTRLGEELYSLKKEYVRFDYKGLQLVPSSPAWESLRGYTRYGGIIDELGLFRQPAISSVTSGEDEEAEDETPEEDQGKAANADEAYRSITNSLTTIQEIADDLFLNQGLDFMPKGIIMGVSSPTSHNDKVMRLLRESRREPTNQYIFGVQLPTWEVNPGMDRYKSRPILLAYAKNAEKAERDYGANPPRTHSAFITSDEIQDNVFVGPKSSHIFEYEYLTNGTIGGSVRKVRSVLRPTVMAIDAGLSDNSFCLSCISFDFTSGKLFVETTIEIIPTKGRKINFPAIYKNVILPIARDNNSRILLADRWNSVSMIQAFTIDLPGTKSRQFTLKRKHFDNVRSTMNNGLLILPTPEMGVKEILELEVTNYRKTFMGKPVAHLFHQMTTVKDMGPTRAPEKGDGNTDDGFRAFSLAAALITDTKILEILKEAMVAQPLLGQNTGATFHSRSGYSGNLGHTTGRQHYGGSAVRNPNRK